MKNKMKAERMIIKETGIGYDFIANKEILDKYISMNGNVQMIATDGNGNKITCLLHKYYDHDVKESFILQDVVAEVRRYSVDVINKDNESREYFENFPKINGYYCEVDAFPTYDDWIIFPLTNARLYPLTERGESHYCNHLIQLGKYSTITPSESDGTSIVKEYGNSHYGLEFAAKDRIAWLVENGVKVKIKTSNDCNCCGSPNIDLKPILGDNFDVDYKDYVKYICSDCGHIEKK